MEFFTELFKDQDLLQIILRSLQVSTTAVVLGSIIGIPLGSFLAARRFVGKKFVMTILYTSMSLPPVVIGVVVYLLLSRSGPFGFLSLLYTPEAMIIAQFLLVMPLITGLTFSAINGMNQKYRMLARTLGATRFQEWLFILTQAKKSILIGVLTAYGRALSEVGAVTIIGGNIEGHTRVMTTSIVLMTRQGEFIKALYLGCVLLGISFLVNLLFVKQTLEQLDLGGNKK